MYKWLGSHIKLERTDNEGQRKLHYYQFNIGDYASHTARLSPMEDLAYRRLLDLYYLNERPFTGSIEDIAREIGLNECLTSVEYVLNKYFSPDGETWTHGRVELEIEEYHRKRKARSKAGKASGKARRGKGSEQVLNNVELTNNQEPITKNQEPLTNIKDKDTTCPSDLQDKSPVPVQKIVDLYHAELPQLPRVEKITKARRGYINQRWREDLPTLEHWENYFKFVSQSDFLMGRTESGNGREPFRASLEWLTRPGNFAKVAEEKYHG